MAAIVQLFLHVWARPSPESPTPQIKARLMWIRDNLEALMGQQGLCLRIVCRGSSDPTALALPEGTQVQVSCEPPARRLSVARRWGAKMYLPTRFLAAARGARGITAGAGAHARRVCHRRSLRSRRH